MALPTSPEVLDDEVYKRGDFKVGGKVALVSELPTNDSQDFCHFAKLMLNPELGREVVHFRDMLPFIGRRHIHCLLPFPRGSAQPLLLEG